MKSWSQNCGTHQGQKIEYFAKDWRPLCPLCLTALSESEQQTAHHINAVALREVGEAERIAQEIRELSVGELPRLREAAGWLEYAIERVYNDKQLIQTLVEAVTAKMQQDLARMMQMVIETKELTLKDDARDLLSLAIDKHFANMKEHLAQGEYMRVVEGASIRAKYELQLATLKNRTELLHDVIAKLPLRFNRMQVPFSDLNSIFLPELERHLVSEVALAREGRRTTLTQPQLKHGKTHGSGGSFHLEVNPDPQPSAAASRNGNAKRDHTSSSKQDKKNFLELMKQRKHKDSEGKSNNGLQNLLPGPSDKRTAKQRQNKRKKSEKDSPQLAPQPLRVNDEHSFAYGYSTRQAPGNARARARARAKGKAQAQAKANAIGQPTTPSHSNGNGSLTATTKANGDGDGGREEKRNEDERQTGKLILCGENKHLSNATDCKVAEKIAKVLRTADDWEQKADRILECLDNSIPVYKLEFAGINIADLSQSNDLAIAKVLRSLRSISKLKFKNLITDSSSIINVLTSLLSVERIEVLSIERTRLYSSDELISLLIQSHSLHTLCLSSCSLEFVRDPKSADCAKLLEASQTLRKLKLKDCELTDLHIESMREPLANNTTLKTLDLSSNPISTKGMERLLTSCHRNLVLEKLSLKGTLAVSHDLNPKLVAALEKRPQPLYAYLD